MLQSNKNFPEFENNISVKNQNIAITSLLESISNVNYQ